ncbi:MAG: type II toxin-antitoxin system RelE/ParE family toxin [Dysgonamonadaceae bacterium]|jgi:mRNA interferase RelE/StbE|nr:type II toxin-antitoxin system RelE/ParE family toxin [Dysgonamonadaceae bacterium]
MEIIYLRSFYKDLQSIPDTDKKYLKDIILLCKKAEKIEELPSLKKLKGHSIAYRIRMGNYRIGIFIEKKHITFVRIVHRKDIYKQFP